MIFRGYRLEDVVIHTIVLYLSPISLLVNVQASRAVKDRTVVAVMIDL